jgi:hypothetical protein
VDLVWCRALVSDGKLRLVGNGLVAAGHYQVLPAATQIHTDMKQHVIFWLVIILLAAWIGLYI